MEGTSTSIFAVGGSTGDVFGRAETRRGSDTIAAALTSDGSFLRGVQIPVESGSGFATSVAIESASREPGLLVAAQYDIAIASRTTIVLHRLRLDTLLPWQEEARLNSFGFVQPFDIAVSPKFKAASNQSVSFVAGSARISEDKKNDIVCDINSRYANKSEKVTLYCRFENASLVGFFRHASVTQHAAGALH